MTLKISRKYRKIILIKWSFKIKENKKKMFSKSALIFDINVNCIKNNNLKLGTRSHDFAKTMET